LVIRAARPVVVAVEQAADELVGPEVGSRGVLARRPPLEGQGGVEVVRAVVDPLAQDLAAGLGEGGLQLLAVLDRDDGPAHGTEELLDLGEQLLRHDAIQALAVVVDHPPEIADVVFPALEQGLEDVALVELGVADDRHHPPGRPILGDEPVQADIVLGQGREERHGSTEADRARGEVDRCRVLGPGRVGLRPAQGPEPLERVSGLLAQEVVGGVHDRARMRLDGDPVARPEHVEEKRRHDGRDRGAGGLVAADLELVAARPQVVGVVDRPGREPEQLLLDRRQHAALLVGKVGTDHGLGLQCLHDVSRGGL
jgi:hypothetical protein